MRLIDTGDVVSLEAMTWVLNDAPSLPSHAFAVLMGLANHADPEGKGAYSGQKRLSHYSRKTDRQVRRDLETLESIGLIRRGNQRLVAHIPADERPIVWDLAMDRRMPDWHFDKQNPEGVHDPADDPEGADTSVRPDTSDRTSTTGHQRPPGHERPDVDVRPDAHDRTPTAEGPDVDVLPTVPEPTTTDSLRSSEAPKRTRPTKRGSRIPDDFAITTEMRAWGEKEFPDLDGAAITDEFIDYWRGVPGVKGEKTDWVATWRNWIRREARDRANRPAPRGHAQPGAVAPSRNMQILAAAEARLDAQEAAQANVIQGEAW